jgi:choline monooxygenase
VLRSSEENHPDAGKKIAAYYFWIFPNNDVQLLSVGTKHQHRQAALGKAMQVTFLTYIYDESKFDKGGAAMLDTSRKRRRVRCGKMVQRGIESSFIQPEDFRLRVKKGVHQFHLLLSAFMNKA